MGWKAVTKAEDKVRTGQRPPASEDIFGEIPRDKWRSMERTEKELVIIEALLTGKYLRWSFSNDTYRRLPGNMHEYMNRFIEAGFFDGVAPLLSDKGKRYLEGLRLVAGKE